MRQNQKFPKEIFDKAGSREKNHEFPYPIFNSYIGGKASKSSSNVSKLRSNDQFRTVNERFIKKKSVSARQPGDRKYLVFGEHTPSKVNNFLQLYKPNVESIWD